jgi:Xaa-Pro dipeptidase
MTIDRRDFMKFGGLTTLAFAVDPSNLAQDAPVKLLASQAKPISREEYLHRQETARRYMNDAGMDAIFLTSGASLQYFTNAQWGLSERLFALVFPVKGELAWVAPAFEKGRALEQIKYGTDVRTWQEDESPYKLVASILNDRGIVTGRLGIEETVRFAFSDGVAKAAPAVKLTSADPVTARCRRIKSAHEIELIRLANQITLKSFEIALKSLQEGLTHNELSSRVAAAHQQFGTRGGALVLLLSILLTLMELSHPKSFASAISYWLMADVALKTIRPT